MRKFNISEISLGKITQIGTIEELESLFVRVEKSIKNREEIAKQKDMEVPTKHTKWFRNTVLPALEPKWRRELKKMKRFHLTLA